MKSEDTLSGTDITVVGAGLIGLAVAFELAERGANVRVYDRGEPGRGASWAGAGMLAPYSEHIADLPLLELCARSLDRYPRFVQRVAAAGGVAVDLALDGIVEAAFDSIRLEQLASFGRDLQARGIRAELLDRREALLAEPALGKHVAGALLIRGQGYVDNRRLGRALLAAIRARGVTVQAPVEGLVIECDARRVLGIRTELGFTPADWVVNAAGAWAAGVAGLPAEARPAVRPVKGQMLALAAPAGLLRRPVWVPGAYLVPRTDGRLLVGATSEEAGFDQRVTAEAISSLLQAALAAAPALGSFTMTESWAGLRPATPDGRPFIGPTAIDGLIVAAGHYRNGILLSPETAELVASFVESGDDAPLQPWLPVRMSANASRIMHA
ncbi:MAG TPA: glycine oxidase ThiO [Candidatus Baltobacteraceae bacterium]|nr:glycine oxidase ThiO [Candidatus Baltobacteraceae bacterium]